jgi:hypothetical protein
LRKRAEETRAKQVRIVPGGLPSLGRR